MGAGEFELRQKHNSVSHFPDIGDVHIAFSLPDSEPASGRFQVSSALSMDDTTSQAT